MNDKKASVFEIFADTASRFGDRPFLHIPVEAAKGYSDRNIDYTYNQALDLIIPLSQRYRSAGLGCGARVALLLENRAEFFLHWLALNAIGVSIVPLNAEASITDLAYIVDDSGPAFALALKEQTGLAAKIMDAAKQPKPILDVSTLAGLEAFSGPASNEAPTSESECALLYTSGSTGKPKGCILSNQYFDVIGHWYCNIGGYCQMTDGEERLLTPLPLSHMNALSTSTMAMIISGGCLIQLDRFHPSTWWHSVRTSGATIVHYLGVLPAILLQLPASKDDRAHHVKFGFGAGINIKHHLAFEGRFGFNLIESWSMTEVGGAAAVVANTPPRRPGLSCFGTPPATMEWRLVDDQGQDVTPGTPGEFLVRRAGPDPRAGFFSGYFGNQKATDEAWAGGWFHTGDLVKQGPAGELYFVDRKKSIIRRAGENISSLEVEAVLSQLPGVAAVGASPVEDEIRGEEVFVAIVAAKDITPSQQAAEEIFKDAAKSLTYFKLPGYIAFTKALPLTASQKLQRGELKVLAKQLVEAGKVYDLRHLKKKPKAGS